MLADEQPCDVLVVGGGINGAGIARDAAGRGLKVLLCERGDLAGATSSASSKLVHGGLRYLEQYEFRLVRESLIEREVLLAAAGHLVWPLRFVLPVHAGLRPPWLIRLGLFVYDHIGGRKILPPTRTVRRGRDAELDPLGDSYRLGFEYSDCWVDDARLVVATAMDAALRGAEIMVGWALVAAERDGANWIARLVSRQGDERTVRARSLVNAAGPWVGEVLRIADAKSNKAPRLVKGSHIVVPRLYPEPNAFTFQSADGRVIFTIPYDEDFTLIGTTDIPFNGDPKRVAADQSEVAYLCAAVSSYLKTAVTPDEVVWTYAGVRPLYDDGESNASAVTRDYVFDLDAPPGGAPLLSIFGGKLTTHRRLAEHALRDLKPLLGFTAGPWTAAAKLPGAPDRGLDALKAESRARYPFAPAAFINRLCRSYGTRLDQIIGAARDMTGLGAEIAPGVYEAELRYMRDCEWAHSADDALWRRSKLGLRLTAEQRARVAEWFEK